MAVLFSGITQGDKATCTADCMRDERPWNSAWSCTWVCCATASVQCASGFWEARLSYLCGDWILDTANHDGKSGFLQKERSSSRALIVSLSPCSRYSSSERYLNTNFFDLKWFFIFLEWNETISISKVFCLIIAVPFHYYRLLTCINHFYPFKRTSYIITLKF